MTFQLGDLYWFCKGCGVRLGYQLFFGHKVERPYWHRRPRDDHPYPYCQNCYRGFKVRHLGQGLFVRPREESDVPVGGPGLEELYGEVKA